MRQPVAVGDDGRGITRDPDDGPLREWLSDKFTSWKKDWRDALRDHRYALRQAAVASQPAYAPITKSGTIASDGNLVLSFGGPELGRRWVVRMVTISDAGAFWTTMSSAQAVVCTGMQPTGDTILPNNVRWPFSQLPNSATFGSDQFWVNTREKVLIAVTGGTSGQNVQATVWLQDFALESVPFVDESV